MEGELSVRNVGRTIVGFGGTLAGGALGTAIGAGTPASIPLAYIGQEAGKQGAQYAYDAAWDYVATGEPVQDFSSFANSVAAYAYNSTDVVGANVAYGLESTVDALYEAVEFINEVQPQIERGMLDAFFLGLRGYLINPISMLESVQRANNPIILDLDGNGISVTELSQSTHFVDGGDGLKHRTAWAAAGDGVLFYDVSGDGEISEKREYVFTDWDPSATSDLEALRSVFDTNGDGKLTAADSTFGSFKVMVTKADGTTEAKTLSQLGITEIDLMGDATRIELPDGSAITGKTTFKYANGSTGTVADMILMADEDGVRIMEMNLAA
ncbi:MAG: hypothetical protein R3D60_03290 [Paracoccaceae bacterium]